MRATCLLLVACACALPARGASGAEADTEERLKRVEERLERLEKVWERMAPLPAGEREKVAGDKALCAAIECAETKYGLGGVAQTLAGADREAAIGALHKRLLTLLYEKEEKAEPDPDLLLLLSALLRLRGAELGNVLDVREGAARLLTDPASGSAQEGGMNVPGAPAARAVVRGGLGRTLGKLLAEALALPALERFAAAEAHLFPPAPIQPELVRLRARVQPGDTARRRRLLAAHAATSDPEALRELRMEIEARNADVKWLKQLAAQYAYDGKPFGLLAMAVVVEAECSKTEDTYRKGYVWGAAIPFMQLAGKGEEMASARAETLLALGPAERADAAQVAKAIGEAMVKLLHRTTAWVMEKQERLVFDADGGVFMSR